MKAASEIWPVSCFQILKPANPHRRSHDHSSCEGSWRRGSLSVHQFGINRRFYEKNGFALFDERRFECGRKERRQLELPDEVVASTIRWGKGKRESCQSL